MLKYDPASGMPDVSVTFDPDLPDTAQIRLAGQIVAHVANGAGLGPQDIALVPRG